MLFIIVVRMIVLPLGPGIQEDPYIDTQRLCCFEPETWHVAMKEGPTEVLCLAVAMVISHGTWEGTHRPLSSSFLGLPYRILNISHKKELIRGLWVE